MFRFEVSYQNDSKIWVDLSDWVRPITNKSTLDETHDESQIFLSCSSIDTPFKPFTHFIINVIEIDDETNMEVTRDTLYRVVIADEIEQVVFDEDRQLYDHNIRLAEATKELERYTVDNLSFTNYWAKAFQGGEAGFTVSNKFNAELYDLTWTDGAYIRVGVSISSTSGIYYFPGAFTSYNSLNAYFDPDIFSPKAVKPNFHDTYIYQTLYRYSSVNNFSLSNKLSSNVITNSQIIIPSLNFGNIESISLANIVSNVFWREVANANFKRYLKAVNIISPTGMVTTVNVGDTITLDTDGVYKIQYVVNSDVKMNTYSLGIISGKTSNEKSTEWINVEQSFIELEIYALAQPKADISKLSIYDILNKICQVTPTRFKDTDQQKFFISDEARAKYGGVEAPELIITGKNLWEALKIIGGIVNAIPYLKIEDQYNWNVIDFMPLSSEEREADTVEQEYCNTTANYLSDSYTASYDIYAENLINPLSTNEGQINETGWYIGKTLRSEEVEISETSMDIETVYPIYRVNKLRYVDYSTTPITNIDLTYWVEEWALYNTEDSDNVSSGKATHLYFTQGKRNIYGLQYKVSQNDYVNAQNKVAIKKIVALASGGTLQENQVNLLTAKFIVEYVPYLNARIRYFKTNAPKLNIDTSMFQNQSSNVIDTIALGRKMVANLGRTSNLGYVDSLKVYHLNEIPLKGQRTKDGYFVSDVVVEYDSNHLLASVSYTKDYQKISDYINIQNLQRYFEVSEKQSLDRYVNTHMFYVFGSPVAEINKEFGLNLNGDTDANYPDINYMASLLYDHGYNRKINGSLINSYGYNYQLTTDLTYQAGKAYYSKTGDRYDYLVPDTDYEIGDAIEQPNTTIYDTALDLVARLYLNSNAISSGNQISIITDFQDNYGAGYQAKPYQSYWHSSDWFYHGGKDYYKLDNGIYVRKIPKSEDPNNFDYVVGDMVATTNNYETTNARMNKAVPYANQYGEIKEMLIYNLTDSSIIYTPSAQLEANMTDLANALPALTDLDANNKPIPNTNKFLIRDSYTGDNIPTLSAIGCKQPIQLNKDSREIIHINQQHHFLKNDDSIVIGNAMTEKCRFIQLTDFDCRLVFLKDTIDDYEFKIKAEDIIPVEHISSSDYVRSESSSTLYELCRKIWTPNTKEILSSQQRDGFAVDYRIYGTSMYPVSVNKTTFANKVQIQGFYTFNYDGTNWTYAGQIVDLAEYGITYGGTAYSGDHLNFRYSNSVYLQPVTMYNGYIAGLTQDAKAWAIVTNDNDLIIGQNIDLYADDLTHDNRIPPIYMSVTSQY